MSNDINRATLLGRLGADPDLFGDGERAKLSFRIATSQKWRDKSGADKEATQWNTCVLWGRRASALKPYLRKGSRVYVEGRVESRSYDDKDGVKKYVTEINVSEIVLLDGKSDGASSGASRSSGGFGFGSKPSAPAKKHGDPVDRDEIPDADFGGGGEDGDSIPF